MPLQRLKNPAYFKVPVLRFKPSSLSTVYSWLANLGLNLHPDRSSKEAQELTVALQLATTVSYAGAHDVQEARGRFEKLFELVPLLKQYPEYAAMFKNFGEGSSVDFTFDTLQTETALRALALEWIARSEFHKAA